MKVFIICSVRGASEEYRTKLETYVSELEKNGVKVHLPHRDTNQNARGFDICMQNANAIKEADEVHIFYNSASQGTHFDMGVSFVLGKTIIVVENEKYGEGKSYPKMLEEWQNENLNSFEKTEERGKKINKKDLLSNNLATKKGYCTQRMGICGVACVAPAARHDIYTVLSAFNFLIK